VAALTVAVAIAGVLTLMAANRKSEPAAAPAAAGAAIR
jgi:hypothetical protein